jgi:hypothetical protein
MSIVDSYDGGSKRPEINFVDQVTYDSRGVLMEVVCMETSSERVMVSGRRSKRLNIDLGNAVARIRYRVFKSEGREVMPHTETSHGREVFQVHQTKEAISMCHIPISDLVSKEPRKAYLWSFLRVALAIKLETRIMVKQRDVSGADLKLIM